MTRLAILGSTGSIGRQALEVVDALAGEIRVVALGARRDAEGLLAQARRYRPQAVALVEETAAAVLRAGLVGETAVYSGPDALTRLTTAVEADVVLVAVVGVAGLAPALAALRAGCDLALATKEALVAGGALVMREARERGRRVLPVDSEHAAVAQCLRGEDPSAVRRILLTGSGGPFLRRPLETLRDATPQEALAHPTWRMGAKITVDSATLMNKGLEVIEAHWLFGLAAEQIDVVIHPQSVVHSLVEFVDGSVKAQLAPPDMRLVIAHALTAPMRRPLPALPAMEWDGLQLTFERPDPARYPCLGLAYDALRRGGTMPAVLNAANEVAVERFLAGGVPFTGIARAVAETMAAHHPVPDPTLEEIVAADAWARGRALAALG
ncbi:MAG: 1-deoxy-D-xylulose-5-phosphate reductoisomerase [Armatimonadota bacterium]|nr:1-deoxy-D-xylulose-5-phosphate reductoisomerase [Armatimonadota bacterium]MDR7451579.1 1-deoxy-D-xylulose-5-phosphate reductoisomerase [Armatimonadota bacterium]MDR7467701.1 1-deoxy-D-xylulose-5-phosphate reductoisomerase [Armatimonadota bacterium]MDR7492548.1 1-deoxy-D-xylulose-5-phosphate reductoisomerase [Armatimonadota bacterium]MDR7500578.1 1-deoxy-D-xylulose-5-phosphate reductoisomerase [Armatimonadota bacterium]